MFFLLRTGFWFSLVLLALPLGGGEAVGPVQAFLAARGAVSDISSLCERRPDVCVTGSAAIRTVGVRAREGSRIAFEMLDKQFGSAPQDADGMTTGTVGEAKDGMLLPLPEEAPLPPR